MILRRIRSCQVRLVIAWLALSVGCVGFVLSAMRVIGKEEPLMVLLLSWAALVYEGFNATGIESKDD